MNAATCSFNIGRAAPRSLHRPSWRRYDANLLRSHYRVSSTRPFSSDPVLYAEDSTQEPINAAPEMKFDEEPKRPSRKREHPNEVLRRIRIVPASPSYFSAKPRFTDDAVSLQKLYRKYQTLPIVRPQEAPRVRWRSLDAIRMSYNEKIRSSRHTRTTKTLELMNRIHPSVMPEEVQKAILEYGDYVNETIVKPRPEVLDEFGRARALGRRKSSSALVYLVEGEGDILINGKPMHNVFSRVHDRESVLWALKTTRRIDKYNVFGLVSGGGTTGQAEALTLGIARALTIHEPGLKTALRKVGVIHRDPRRVERKKPGKLKARKMPAWVKR